MPKLKVLSGKDVIKILTGFGFEVAHQDGSHVKLVRYLSNSHKQSLTVPNHRELDKGTLLAIFRQSSRYVAEEKLRPHFYTQ